MKVGIVGGGAAGLTAAYELGKLGHSVFVYERAPFLGGQASTFDVEGSRLERAYHHLFTSDTDILGLIDEIGLGHQMRWIKSSVGTFHNGKIYDFVTPFDLLRFTALSLIDRIRLGLVTLELRHKKDWQQFEGTPAVEWLRRKAGKQGYEVFWGPMLRGKFGEEHFSHVGMAWVWSKIHTRFSSRSKGLSRELLGYPIGSFGEVFDVLARRIKEQGNSITTSCSVREILIQNGRATGLRLEHVPAKWVSPQAVARDQNDKIDQLTDNLCSYSQSFDAIIATTPSHTFARIVPSLPDNFLSKLTNMDYLAAVLIILVLKRPLSHVYWMNVADRSVPFVGIIEQTNLIQPNHYGDKHIVYLSNYLSTHHPLYDLDKESILAEYLPHLRKINPDFDESWIIKSYHHRVDAAQPIIGPNYSSRIPEHRTPIKSLYLANTTQIYPEDRGTNYSVRMGYKIANMVANDLSG